MASEIEQAVAEAWGTHPQDPDLRRARAADLLAALAERGYRIEPHPLNGSWLPIPEIERLRAIEAMSRDGLDAAWAEAEAALPKGWVLELASPNPYEIRPTFRAEAWNGDGGVVRGFVRADGDSPAAALRALAAKLRDSDGR